MSGESEIPKGWIFTNLGEVCELKNGYAFKSTDYLKDSGIPIIRISDIGEGKIDLKDCVRINEDIEYESYIVNRNEILVAMSGATTGKFGIYRGDEKVYQNQRVGKFKIRFKEVLNNSYLLYLLYSLKQRILKDAYGGAQPNISSGKIEELPFPLPPLPEQHRIVAKIEELFSSLDKGIESLNMAQAQLKVYRQAVLKWAFEGKLTNNDVKDGELPAGWKIEELKKITFKAKKIKVKEQEENEGFKYLDIGGIDNSKLKITSHKTYQWKDAPSRAQQIVEVGDTLFSTVRTYLKNIALVDKEIYHNQICSSGFTVIRADQNKIKPKFLFFYSTYQGFINSLNKLQTGTSYPAVRDEDVFSQKINYPISLKEQQLIVSEIESRLSVCDKIEESIILSLLQAEALRQSILKKAFEGKLVPQDPDDKPASVLLERIKAGRESQQQVEVKRKASRSTKRASQERTYEHRNS